MTTFCSLTDWQAEHYVVTVRVDGFATESEALAFGNARDLRLQMKDRRLTLTDPAGEARIIGDEQACLARLRPERRHQGVQSMDDYVALAVSVDDYHELPGLAGSFTSLSYGVLESCRKI